MSILISLSSGVEIRERRTRERERERESETSKENTKGRKRRKKTVERNKSSLFYTASCSAALHLKQAVEMYIDGR